MIRTGYLRWEIDVSDDRSAVDPRAREVTFRARPSYRVVRVKNQGHRDASERFVRGEDTYDVVLRNLQKEGSEADVTIPDVGPHVFRYSLADRDGTPRFWMSKLQREVRNSGESQEMAVKLVRVVEDQPGFAMRDAVPINHGTGQRGDAACTGLDEFQVGFRAIERRIVQRHE